jgi:hypothetical protein
VNIARNGGNISSGKYGEMTVLEHIKNLSEALSAEDKLSLAAFLSSMENSANRKPRDLYGIWKDGFPKDFDVDVALREIRGEWEKEVEEIIP